MKTVCYLGHSQAVSVSQVREGVPTEGQHEDSPVFSHKGEDLQVSGQCSGIMARSRVIDPSVMSVFRCDVMVRVVDPGVRSVFRCDVMVRVADPSVMSMFTCDVMVRVVDPSVMSVFRCDGMVIVVRLVSGQSSGVMS